MRVNYTTGTMNVSSRAIKNVTLAARYRFNSRSDFTREFDAIEYVRFDAVPEETGGASEAFNINRNTLDVSAASPGSRTAPSARPTCIDQYEHGVRATQGYKDDTARISYDLVGNQYADAARAVRAHEAPHASTSTSRTSSAPAARRRCASTTRPRATATARR